MTLSHKKSFDGLPVELTNLLNVEFLNNKLAWYTENLGDIHNQLLDNADNILDSSEEDLSDWLNCIDMYLHIKLNTDIKDIKITSCLYYSYEEALKDQLARYAARYVPLSTLYPIFNKQPLEFTFSHLVAIITGIKEIGHNRFIPKLGLLCLASMLNDDKLSNVHDKQAWAYIVTQAINGDRKCKLTAKITPKTDELAMGRTIDRAIGLPLDKQVDGVEYLKTMTSRLKLLLVACWLAYQPYRVRLL